jgi:hypothetical protein
MRILGSPAIPRSPVDGRWHRITRIREAVLNLKTISAIKSYQAKYGMTEPVMWWEHV